MSGHYPLPRVDECICTSLYQEGLSEDGEPLTSLNLENQKCRFVETTKVIISPDGRKVYHDRFGEGTIFAYTIVFKNAIISLSYPGNFEKNSITIIREKEDVR